MRVRVDVYLMLEYVRDLFQVTVCQTRGWFVRSRTAGAQLVVENPKDHLPGRSGSPDYRILHPGCGPKERGYGGTLSSTHWG